MLGFIKYISVSSILTAVGSIFIVIYEISELSNVWISAIGPVLVLTGAFWSSIKQSHFEERLSEKNNEISKLNNKIINFVTGGDSFCYFSINKGSISSEIKLVLIHQGEYPLYDLRAECIDLDSLNPVTGYARQSFEIGNVSPNVASSGPWKIVFNAKTQLRYNIPFSSRGGFFTQELRLFFINGDWRMASRVKATRLLAQSPLVLHEKVDQMILEDIDNFSF